MATNLTSSYLREAQSFCLKSSTHFVGLEDPSIVCFIIVSLCLQLYLLFIITILMIGICLRRNYGNKYVIIFAKKKMLHYATDIVQPCVFLLLNNKLLISYS